MDVLELRLAHCLVRTSDERSGLLGAVVLAEMVLARVNEGVAEGVALEVSECFLRALSPAETDVLVQTDFMALLTERLVARARISHCEAGRHREERIAWSTESKRQKRLVCECKFSLA